jgi:hypothetical protein
MTAWKKVLVAASTGVTLVVMATVAAAASGTGRDALRAVGTRAVLMASTSPGSSSTAPRGGVASGPGLGPVVISIGKTWTLDGPLVVRGTVTITCGPFLSNSGESFAQATVEDAPGSQVGHGSASTPLTCDGAKHQYAVSVLVNDLPFKAGDGAVGVNANPCGEDPSSFQFVCQSGSAVTPVTLK